MAKRATSTPSSASSHSMFVEENKVLIRRHYDYAFGIYLAQALVYVCFALVTVLPSNLVLALGRELSTLGVAVGFFIASFIFFPIFALTPLAVIIGLMHWRDWRLLLPTVLCPLVLSSYLDLMPLLKGVPFKILSVPYTLLAIWLSLDWFVRRRKAY